MLSNSPQCMDGMLKKQYVYHNSKSSLFHANILAFRKLPVGQPTAALRLNSNLLSLLAVIISIISRSTVLTSRVARQIAVTKSPRHNILKSERKKSGLSNSE
jgi:hypothetical protein